MRFIHTADWHLGNRMHEIDRKAEADAFLDWLYCQIIEQHAEALFIAGDVFDTANPPLEAQKQYYSFLARLTGTDCRNIIITAGNHDSAALIAASKDMLELLNIHVVGSIANLTAENMIFELYGKESQITGIAAAVPFMREPELRRFQPAGGDTNAAYKAVYDAVYEAARNKAAGAAIPLIATGHLYAANLEGRLANANASIKTDDGVKVLDVVGNLGSVPASIFPEGFDYVALGHIHYTTQVAGNPKIRYSGSPFLLGFDEWQLPRQVLCVDVTAGAIPKVTKLSVPHYYVYQRIEGTIDEIRHRLETMAGEQYEKTNFIEIAWKKEADRNIQLELEETISRLPENIHVVSWKTSASIQDYSDRFADVDMSELRELDEKDVFTRLIRSKLDISTDTPEGKQLLEKYLALFMEIAEGVTDADN